MTYPSVDDYRRAVQNPAKVFTTPDLQRATFATHPVMRVPIPATGSTAAVFQAEVAGQQQALRFFTREDARGRERYEALGSHLTRTGVLSSQVARSTWQDDAVRIRDRAWPVVRMEWIEGRTLERYVGHLVEQGDTGALGALARAWRKLMCGMQTDRFAHGDLQHGNVLVDQQGRLRLVDLDAVWIEELNGYAAPDESGHPNYQRKDLVWGMRMDTFPGLVIYLSLRALAVNPQPWHTLHNEDNLLFTREDFEHPSTTPAWKHLAAIRDPAVDKLIDQLRLACQPSWKPVDDFDALLARAGEAVRTTASTTSPWWEQAAADAKYSSRPTPSPEPTDGSLPPPPKKDPNAGSQQRPGTGPTSEQQWSHGTSQQTTTGPRAGSEYWGTKKEEELKTRDGRHWKSLCLAAILGSAFGLVVAAMTASAHGSAGAAFTVAFLCVGLLTYLIALGIFGGRPPKQGP